MKKIIFVLVSLLSVQEFLGQAIASVAPISFGFSENHISYRPIDIMIDPGILLKVRFEEAVSIDLYSAKEKEIQVILNKKTNDAIVAYSPLSEEQEWIGIDYEEITPFTWKWIDFEMLKPNGTYSKVHLRRPHWWMIENGVDSVGKKIYLDIPGFGINGVFTVAAIRVNQLDTRFWDERRDGDYVSRPITGKAEHHTDTVVDLYFDNSNESHLSVTPDHLIWSLDRNGWFKVDSLKIGERIKTREGNVILSKKILKKGNYVVYNLEIYKDHNFLVGKNHLLVHNGCIDDIKALKVAGRTAEFNAKLQDFKWGDYLESILGVPRPPGMYNAHAHHIVMKSARPGSLAASYSAKSRTILEKYGVDPYFGKENLTWAPNADGNHSDAAQKEIYETLERASQSGGRQGVIDALKLLGEKAANSGFKR